MMYRIMYEGELVEAKRDLLDAMRRSRCLAERNARVYEIRDEEDFILVVTVSSKRDDRNMSMPKAVRHNARLSLQKQRENRTAEGKCPATNKPHEWQTEPPQHRLLYRCLHCQVLGYQIGGTKMVAHKCTVCSEPAKIERKRNVLRHRWSCEKHVEF